MNSFLKKTKQPTLPDFRLPTESEFEYASRGGLDASPYPWGGPYTRNMQGCFLANFKPLRGNYSADGGIKSIKTASYNPNGYGLYDMSGNVWEWVADWYHISAYEQRINSKGDIVNPTGPDKSYDPQEPHLSKRVIRGGSFLCNDSYCSGYRPAARMRNSPDTSTNHTGFRIVKNID